MGQGRIESTYCSAYQQRLKQADVVLFFIHKGEGLLFVHLHRAWELATRVVQYHWFGRRWSAHAIVTYREVHIYDDPKWEIARPVSTFACSTCQELSEAEKAMIKHSEMLRAVMRKHVDKTDLDALAAATTFVGGVLASYKLMTLIATKLAGDLANPLPQNITRPLSAPGTIL